MDVTNRTIIVGGALIGIFLVFLVMLLAWSAPTESINRLADLSGYLDDHNNTGSKLIITFLGLIIVLLAGLVVVFEVAPPESGSIRVAKAGSGTVRIGTDEVVQQLESDLATMIQLSGVQAHVEPRGRKGFVKLDLYVTANADIAATTEEAIRRTRELLEGRMGIELDGPPHAQIHYRELRVARPATPAPSSPSSPAPAPSPSPPSAQPAHEPAEQREDAPPA
jgi:hypothetical protein